MEPITFSPIYLLGLCAAYGFAMDYLVRKYLLKDLGVVGFRRAAFSSVSFWAGCFLAVAITLISGGVVQGALFLICVLTTHELFKRRKK